VQRAAELSLIRRLLTHLEAGTTELALHPISLPSSQHTSEAQLAAERHALFRGQPIAAALSADLPEPGYFLTLESGGVPLLVVRGEDGRARAYVNVCRHRGAPVAEGRGRIAGGRIRCPFHAWTYDLEGGLASIPLGEAGYAGFDRRRLGLHPRPCSESSGLILVRAEGDEPIDASAWLGEIAGDLAALGLARFHPFASRSTRWQANWKLLLETFLESYHVFSLHRETVHPFYFSLPMVADPIGPHLRFPVARRTLADLRGQPEVDWRLVEHATVQWFLAPNALLSATRDYALLWRFSSSTPNSCDVETHFYTAAPVANDATRKRWHDAFELQLRVTGAEDFPMQEKIQRGLDSGAAPSLVIGTHEIGVIHFHETLAKLIADASSTRDVSASAAR
jgi:phenylpropionate dioxygenase-like ring-hydroxylating dioxygenase large terminal subunit